MAVNIIDKFHFLSFILRIVLPLALCTLHHQHSLTASFQDNLDKPVPCQICHCQITCSTRFARDVGIIKPNPNHTTNRNPNPKTLTLTEEINIKLENVWQNLAYSLLGAVVSPRNKYL